MTMQPTHKVDIPSEVVFPKYRSHKVVGALHITSVQADVEGGFPEKYKIFTEEFPDSPIVVSHDWFDHYTPAAGQVLTQYEDGYLSVSPAEAFVNGYSKIEE